MVDLASEDGIEEFRLDRTQFSVARLTDPDDAVGLSTGCPNQS
jgi:hypothetical protein